MKVPIIGLNETKDTLLISKKEYENVIESNPKGTLDKVKNIFPPEGICAFKYRVYDEEESENRLSIVIMLLEEITFLQKELKNLYEQNSDLKADIDKLNVERVPNENEKVINDGFKEDRTEESKEEQIVQPAKKRGRKKGKKLYEGSD